MSLQTSPNPVRAPETRRKGKTPNRDREASPARTEEEQQAPEQVENMAKDTEQNAPAQKLATEDHVHAKVNDVRVEIAQSETRIGRELGEIKEAIATGFGQSNTAIANLRADLTEKISDKIDANKKWTIGTAIAVAVLILTTIGTIVTLLAL